MACAVLIAALLGSCFPQALAETASEAVSISPLSLSAGLRPVLTQSSASPATTGTTSAAMVPDTPDRPVRDVTGQKLFGLAWSEMRNTGRIAPSEIFVPPKLLTRHFVACLTKRPRHRGGCFFCPNKNAQHVLSVFVVTPGRVELPLQA